MIPTRGSRGTWCLGGLFLVGALTVSLAGAGCRGNGGEQDEGPLFADEAERTGPPLFKDVTAASGVDWSCRNGEEFDHCAILEQVGGGVGLIDFDGDGLLDLFVVGGGYFEKSDKQLAPRPEQINLQAPLPSPSPTGPNHSCAILGHPCKLYKNLGNGTFEDVTDSVLRLDGPWFYSHGCAVTDYDRDGWPDLLLTGWGRVALYHNEPADPWDSSKGRRLVDVTRKVGL